MPDLQDPPADCDWAWLFMVAIWSGRRQAPPSPSCPCSIPRRLRTQRRRVVCFSPAPWGGSSSTQPPLEVLDSLINSDQLQPVDHGWALVQRSRTRAEVGDVTGAQADAVAAQRDFAGDSDDVTVSALAAVAAWQLFATADFDDQDFAEMVMASDTAVSWWRSQTISSALHAAGDTKFKDWAEDRSQLLSTPTGNSEQPELFAAELSADVTAEQGRWRAISALRARQRLMRASAGDDETTEVFEGLDVLRLSGDVQSLKLAVGHIYRGHWKLSPKL